MKIEKLDINKIDEAQIFYDEQAYTSIIKKGDIVIGAIINDKIVGISRVSNEENVEVLRGMFVAKDFRGNGIGKKMLNELENSFKTNKIYRIPFKHLEKFYGSIGFKKVETEQSPQFLQTRLIKYINAGYDCIMMMKQSI